MLCFAFRLYSIHNVQANFIDRIQAAAMGRLTGEGEQQIDDKNTRFYE